MATVPKSPRIVLHSILAVCWCIWGILHAIIIQKMGFALKIGILDSCITNTLLVGGFMIVNNTFQYYLPQKEKLWYLIVFCAALTGILVLIDYLILLAIFRNDASFREFFQSSVPVRMGVIAVMLGWQSLLTILLNTLKEQKLRDDRKNEIEKLAKDAELFKLRQQLQPHFLFNSLNSINALIGIKPQQARTMIEQLSDFLRGSIKKEDQQWTTLSEELDYLQLYLDIEKVRFGYRLNTVVTCDENTGKLQLPPMVLQPIVENAIKFGLYDTMGEVTISITANKDENGYLSVSVQNPFDPETAYPKRGTGFGLSSVQRRLFLLFSIKDLLTTNATDHQFITTIKIPQPKKQELEQVV
ncbi:sensor histidine kinase [Pinibacter soli]|uniref:Histidine kinase n=1 Tax=Pinibacter soli TaxID=3044211 RepID=A0ABT6RJ75_9BACT|nr:histidine kinase [Pinibacter soli]MDI3322573.1 histidine kinase [Pinibacter soli]